MAVALRRRTALSRLQNRDEVGNFPDEWKMSQPQSAVEDIGEHCYCSEEELLKSLVEDAVTSLW